jgi:hypothetical protein
MTKEVMRMLVLSCGVAALVLGIIGIICWCKAFIAILMGAVPAMLILGGALAAYLGVEEIKDKKAADSFDDTGSDLKGEVESLKEEIKEMKEEKKEGEQEDETGS